LIAAVATVTMVGDEPRNVADATADKVRHKVLGMCGQRSVMRMIGFERQQN